MLKQGARASLLRHCTRRPSSRLSAIGFVPSLIPSMCVSRFALLNVSYRHGRFLPFSFGVVVLVLLSRALTFLQRVGSLSSVVSSRRRRRRLFRHHRRTVTTQSRRCRDIAPSLPPGQIDPLPSRAVPIERVQKRHASSCLSFRGRCFSTTRFLFYVCVRRARLSSAFFCAKEGRRKALGLRSYKTLNEAKEGGRETLGLTLSKTDGVLVAIGVERKRKG